MGKLRTFWRTFVKSISDPSYYNDILKVNFWFSFKYLYFLLFVTAFIGSISLALNISSHLPKISMFQKNAEAVIRNFYPEELVITVENGVLSTNVEEPYFIAAPEEVGDILGPDYDPNINVVTIDTSASVEDYLEYDSLILVTDRFIVYLDDNSYKVTSLSKFNESGEGAGVLKIDREVYNQIADSIVPWLNYARPVAYLGIFALIFVIPIAIASMSIFGRLVYLLVVTAMSYLIAIFMSKKIGYKSLYRLSMHALTPSIVLALILEFSPFRLSGWIYLGIYLVFMTIILGRLKTPTK